VSGRNHGFVTQGTVATNLNGSAGIHAAAVPDGQSTKQHVVTQTASWLDRASNILKETGANNGHQQVSCAQQKFSLTYEQAQALQSLPKKEIEIQMKEVERLIHEGPIIQQTTAGLPHILDHAAAADAPQAQTVPSVVVAQSTCASGTPDGQKTPPEPADKRMRTGAEDAEALVGFLTAVRASAAAGTDSFSG
jgi:hypothetical protein